MAEVVTLTLCSEDEINDIIEFIEAGPGPTDDRQYNTSPLHNTDNTTIQTDNTTLLQSCLSSGPLGVLSGVAMSRLVNISGQPTQITGRMQPGVVCVWPATVRQWSRKRQLCFFLHT